MIIMVIIIILRVSITCACSMHLALFPLDEQKCDLDVASCEHPQDHGNDGKITKIMAMMAMMMIVATGCYMVVLVRDGRPAPRGALPAGRGGFPAP